MTNTTTQNISQDQLKPYLQDINRKSDKLIQYFLWAYAAFGLFLAPFHDTWLVALGISSLCLAAYWIPKLLLPEYNLHRCLAGVVFGVFAALFIYQMHGLAEMHFVVFVSSILLVTYQNWKMQIPLLLTVTLHHMTFAYLQNEGMADIYFTQSTEVDPQAFLFHGGLVVMIIAICGIWAYTFRQNTLNNILHTIEMSEKKEDVLVNIRFAEEISKGNLNPHFSLNENDSLSRALLDMRQSLLVANEREQQERFKTVGLAEMSDILRANRDLSELASQLIIKLVKYMKANQGGLFILNDETAQDTHLELAACYAYERKKYLKKTIQIGEGLVGQSALEKDTLYITDVPDDYVNIRSGLGKSNPTSILIVPLMVNEKIEGVIELASFNEFHTFEIEFVQKLGESIASTISSVRTNERTRRLLEDTQQQAEEMRAQEEEMRQNMEELAATQEEIHRKSAEMEKIASESQEQASRLASNEKRITAVLNSVQAAIIQTDNTGVIQSINYVGEQMFGYRSGTLTGSAIETLVPEVKDNHQEGVSANASAYRQDGSTFMVAASFRKIATGEENFLMYFIWDIEKDVQREKEMQEKQREIEDLLEEAQQGEEMLKAQEEVLRQNLEEMIAVQEAMKEKVSEVERVREEERTRATTLIESQKKIMEKVMAKHKEKEGEMQTQIEQLRLEIEQLRK